MPARSVRAAGLLGLALALAGAGLVARRGPAAAQGQPSGHRLYLPVVAQSPPQEPCGPPSTDPCASDESRYWVFLCGGIGRVRDLVIPRSTGPGEALEALAVGDGAAWLTVGPEATPGAAPGLAWRPRLGQDLTGLNALAIDVEASEAGLSGWVVGERDHIAALRAGCVLREDDYDDPRVSLRAASADSPYGGWIVGAAEDGGEGAAAHGILRILADPAAPTTGSWQDFDARVTPPPLTDVAFNYNRSAQVSEAWSVGAEGDEGVFLYGFLSGFDHQWHWGEVARRPGRPRELSIRSNGSEGWAFGPGEMDGQAGVATWLYDRGARINWEQDRVAFWPGQELVDIYTQSRESDENLYVGLSPDGRKPLLARQTYQPRQWVSLGQPPPGIEPGAGDGSRAIAPDTAGRVLYAWDDALWLYREPGATPTPRPDQPTPTPGARPTPTRSAERGSWSLLRRDRPLLGFLPQGSQGWAAAGRGAGASLLAFRAGAFQEVATSERAIRALDQAGGIAWAVGDGGLTLRASEGHWQDLTGEVPIGQLADVAATADGGAWAAGAGPDGFGRVWRWAPGAEGWSEAARTAGATPLTAITALSDGRAWAVGQGCVALALAPGQGPQESSPCRGSTAPVDLAAVTATGARAVWAGGATFAYRWNGLRWSLVRTGLGYGERLVALAAAATDDVWAIGQAAAADGRPASRILHLERGGFRELTVFSVPLVDLRLTEEPSGRRVVWVAGGGSTVARRSYDKGRGLGGLSDGW